MWIHSCKIGMLSIQKTFQHIIIVCMYIPIIHKNDIDKALSTH